VPARRYCDNGAAARRPPKGKAVATSSTQARIVPHPTVSREEWIEARTAFLAKEKEMTRLRDKLAVDRRSLPWLRIDKNYVFEGPLGEVTLDDLFAGRSQLFIKHFMLGPGQVGQCIGCSLEVDHLQGILTHLNNHDVTYAVIARAPIGEIEQVRKRMNWHFPWVSSYRSDFNYDFNVSFTPEQNASETAFFNFRHVDAGLEDLSGDSVFYRNSNGEIFLTYSTFGRGGEEFLGIYRMLDAMPKGRDENGPYHSLGDWVRLNNTYGEGGMVEGNGRYHKPGCACSAHHSKSA
jgi:predicted dithiol-disulfide oxidoreductase (DUF899 family)